MAKGSLSVFFAMIMVAVMSLMFTMSECIRLYELHDFAHEYTDMAVESAFSEYNPYLWSNYKILAVDLGYGTESIGPGMLEQKTLDYCKFNSSVDGGHNYARLSTEGCYVNKYALLTDDNGQAIVTLGVKAAKDGMASQIIDGVQNHIDSINNIEKVPVEDKAKSGKDKLQEAKQSNSDARQAAADDDDPNTNPEDYPEPGQVEDNPLDAFDILKESFAKSVLASVTDVEKISEKEIDTENAPSHRSLNAGNMVVDSDDGLLNKALFVDYLMTNFGYFGKDLKHDGLKYEVEYLIAGKETDSQSLACVIEQILAIRTAANFITIQGSSVMQAEAASIASIIAGFSMNPIIVDLVKEAIMAAWAYAEATLDVRLILSGGKVAPIKTLDQWTSDVWHLSQIANINFKAKGCKVGTGYKEYLMAFLALRNNNTLSMRALDVMENALNSTDDYKNVRMDNLVWASDFQMSFSGNEMFLSLFSSGNESETIGEYYFEKNKTISY